MPRKGPAPRRELMPDPVYRSVLVTQIVNKVLQRGKRSLAERIVYDALDIIEEKTGAEPIATLKRAIDNVKPPLEVKPPRRWRHLPGARRGPAPPGQHARHPLDRRLLAQRREKTMAERLANELLDASNGVGASIKRRDDMQKMAESNKAFAHYRW